MNQTIQSTTLTLQSPLDTDPISKPISPAKQPSSPEFNSTHDSTEADSSDLASLESKEDVTAFEDLKIENEITDKDTTEALNALMQRVRRGDHITEAIDSNIRRKALPLNLKEARVPEVNGDFLCGNMWRREPTEGLEMIDKGITERQRQVLKWMLKNAGRRILEGKSIVNMSLPIIISSKESTLQRAATQCGYSPIFLSKAGQQQMMTEAFKQVVTYFFASHHLGISQEKPFNPILGETYEGFLNGIPVYGEQISHHPPISAIHMKTEHFELISNFQLEMVLGANSAKGLQMGNLIVKLPKLNMEVIGLFAPANISGTAIGKRIFNWSDKMRVYDPKNNLYAEIQFKADDKGFVGNLFSSKKQEADKVVGNIYQLKPEAMKEFHSKKPNTTTKWNFEPEKHSTRTIAAIEGKWTRNLTIGGKSYWNVENPEFKPFLLVDAPNKTLPSDSNYREDLIYRKLGNFEAGQVAKEKMEELQRADKALRLGKKGGKAKH